MKGTKNLLKKFKSAGVEDGRFKGFSKSKNQKTVLCCVILKLDKIENIFLDYISIDGEDATNILLKILGKINIDVLMLGGITFAGFNVIDPFRISEDINVPVIVYSGVRPNKETMASALRRHFIDWRERLSIIERLGEIFEVETRKGEPRVFFEIIGRTPAWAVRVLRSTSLVSRTPEPIRVARLVARGVSLTVY